MAVQNQNILLHIQQKKTFYFLYGQCEAGRKTAAASVPNDPKFLFSIIDSGYAMWTLIKNW